MVLKQTIQVKLLLRKIEYPTWGIIIKTVKV